MYGASGDAYLRSEVSGACRGASQCWLAGVTESEVFFKVIFLGINQRHPTYVILGKSANGLLPF